MEIKVLTPTERNYTYSQSSQLKGQTGSIGHLRGDFDSSGESFFTTWFDHREQWKTEEFKADLDRVINGLRKKGGLLSGRKGMSAFVAKHPESFYGEGFRQEYGFRVDTEKYAFLLRCSPVRGDYNFYCYCYVKEWLDGHIQKAEQGICFIDRHYNEKFRIPDGGKIVIHYAWGEKVERTCRFIDEYHTEVGDNLYHVCEFAERMEMNGHTYEPKPQEPPTAKKAPKHKDHER